MRCWMRFPVVQERFIPVKVEVVYAGAERQSLLIVDIEQGQTAMDAIQLSGILQQFPEIDLPNSEIGIFSQKVSPDHVLEQGDRVEIYRDLLIDPKDRRRDRAKKD